MADPWEQSWASTPDAENGPWTAGWDKPKPAPARNAAAVANDYVIEAANALAGGVAAVGNAVSPGNRLSKFIEKDVIQAGEAKQSEATQQSKARMRAELDAAQGFGDEAAAVGRYAIDSPGLVAMQAVGSILGPGLAMKGAGAAAGALGAGARGILGAEMAAGAATGAAMAGGDAAGAAYEIVMRADEAELRRSPAWGELEAGGLPADQIREQLATRAARAAMPAPAVVGALGGVVGAERAISGLMRGGAARRGAVAGTAEAAEEGFEEGLTQYSGQAAGAQFDSTVDPTKGVAGAATFGAITGGVAGAGTGMLSPGAPVAPVAPPSAADNLTSLVDEYLRGPSAAEVAASVLSAPDVDSAIAAAEAATRSFAEVARDKGAALAPVMDRQAALTAQANAAGTAAERAGAQDQAAVALETATQPMQGAAQQFEDLTPMDKRTAEGRLRVLRDMAANEGGDALSLEVVPHPDGSGKFAIGKTASLPDLGIQAPLNTPAPGEAQQRIESAALAGTETQRKLQDEGRQIILTRALKSVEERGGVASPAEARIFQEAGVGKPYDRIDESLAPPLTTDQTLTQATGIALGNAPRSTTTQPSSPSEQQMVAQEQRARGDSRLQQLERDRQALEAARGDASRMGPPAKPGEAPNVDAMMSILRKDPALLNAQEKVLVDDARRQLGERFGLLERAARAPQTLGAEERLQLRSMRETGLLASAQRETEQAGQPLRYRHSDSRFETGRGEMDASQYTLVRNLARIFGKTVQVFSSDHEDAPDGYVLRSDSRTIYLNGKSQVSHLVVFGHELMHQLRKDNPKAYEAVLKVVRPKKNADLGVAGIRGDMEEFTSDLLGNRFREPAFWAEVFAELNDKPAAARLAAEIGRVIDRIVKALGGLAGFDTDAMVANLEDVRVALKDALATYARDQYGAAQALDRGVSEERAENRTETEQVKPDVSTEPPVPVQVKPDRTERRRLAVEAARRDMGLRFSEPRANNASGESAASLEALSRDRQERAAGQQRVRVSRAGVVTPLTGPSAVDARARAGSGDVILQRGVGKNEWTVLEQDPALGKSAVARATALAPKFSEKRDLFPEEFADRDASVATGRKVSSRGATEPGGNVNSAGQKIQATKQGLANFWRWFAGSQATDDEGRPLVLYHSTNADTDVLRSGEKSSNNYGLLGSFEVTRTGVFLTPDKDFSQEYLRSGSGKNVMPVYARLENPLDLRSGLGEQDEAALDNAGVSSRFVINAQNYWELFDNDENGTNWFVAALQVAGYDGAIFREASPSGETSGGTTYVVFDSEQIKSALGNRGTFDPADPSITKSEKRGQLDNVEAYHYSQEPRKTLSSAMFGTGLRGSARDDYLNADDQRRRQRVSFYFDKGTGVRPEAGVGGVPHRAFLNNVYDSNADPLKLRSGSQAKFESAVLDAGFDGYLDRLDGTQPGQIIMLGKRTIPVQALPPGPVKSGATVAAPAAKPASWTVQNAGPDRGVMEVKAERMRGQPAWKDYDIRVAGAGDSWAVETRLKAASGEPTAATLNVGLSTAEVAGGGSIDAAAVRAALERAGVKVLDLTVHQSDTEPTAVVQIDRPLTAAEGDALSRELQQEAIVQRLEDGTGDLFGPKAEAWGPYNPEYFVLPDGKRAAEPQMAASAKRQREQLNPEIVATLGKHIRNLLPAERAKLRRDTAQRLVERIESLPSSNEMAAVAYAGRAKRGWYKHSAFAIEHVFGADGPRFAALLAALSPQTGVEPNLLNALTTWKNWVLAGRPTSREAIIDVLAESVQGGRGRASVLDAWINNSVRALSSEDPSSLVISGPKVNSFMLNLRGVVDEVTNDTWMANFALVDQTIFGGKLTKGGDPGKGVGYLAMSAQVRAAAKTLTRLTGEEWTPAEVQETIWSWAKTLYESASVNKSAAEIVLNDELSDELIQATPDFRTLFHDDVNEQLLRDAGLGEQVGSLRGRAAPGRAGQQVARPEGEAAPFARDAQKRYELRAARRLDELRARGLSQEEDAGVAYSAKRNNFGGPVNSVWQMPGMSRVDNLTYTIQDKLVDTKRAIKAIRAAGRVVDEQFNAYDKETLYHGRTSKQTKDFHDLELRPLLEEMRAARVEIAEFEEFLHNRHAEERNEQVAKIGGMADGGSGIKTADARAYLAALPAAQRRVYDRLARRVDTITKGTRDYLVSTGMETQQTISSWENAYSGYVPLNREEYEELGGGTGMGYSVRGAASKRALGSDKAVSNILGNVARQREAAIVRAEKNRVAKAVYGLFVKHPNTDLALPVDPAMMKRDPQGTLDGLLRLGLSPFDAQSIVAEPVQRTIDPRTGMIVERVNPTMRNRENVMGVRVNGEDRFIFFSETDERAQRMVRALKNLDAPALGEVMTAIGKGTRWLSSVNTQYNPVFGIFNFARDFGGAMFNLTSTPLAGAQKQVAGDALSALRGIYIDLREHRAGRTPNSAWARLFEEFQQEGGQTGYRDLFRTPQEREANIEDEFRILSEGKAKAIPRAMFQWLSDYNEAIENSIRLAAYKAGKDRGMTNQQAAVVAKNLTVNFNRKGEIATQAGALYGFFNAAVQGTDRLRQTLTGPAGKKILAGGLLLGALQAALLAAAGFDDEEPPEFTRDRSFIIPTGDGKYIAVPLPLGLHVLPAFARRTVEFANRGFKDPAKFIGGQLGLLLDSFNPIGGGSDFIAAITPSVADPAIALARNQDWTGRPITREDFNSLKPTPGFTRSKDSATWLSTQLATFLNWASGGTEYKPGLASPTADQIDYLVGQVFGGVARELGKLEQTVTAPLTGEDLPTYKIPLVGRLIGNVNEAAAERGRYYENVRKMNLHEAEIDGRRKDGKGATVREYLAEHPEARLFEQAKSIEKQVKELQQRKRKLIERDAPAAQVRLVDEAIVARMRVLNQRVRKLEEMPSE